MGGVRDFLRDLGHIKRLLIVILTPIILLPFLVVDGGGSEAKCAYCVAIMAVYWISEALPIAVTALLPAFLFPVLGVLSLKEISSKYLNDISMLFLGGLIVAAAIEHWNIHKRIALRILMLVGAQARWIMLGLMAPTWFLSMWISNTATTAMMVPITNAILLQLKDTDKQYQNAHANDALELNEINVEDSNGIELEYKHDKAQLKNGKLKEDKDDAEFGENVPDNVVEEGDNPEFVRLCKCLTLSIAYAANTGGIGSLTGTGPNLVMKGQLDEVYEQYKIKDNPITFTSWMAFGVPLSFTLVIIVWVWLQILFLRGQQCCSSDKEKDIRVKSAIRKQYEKLGPINFGQGAVVAHFLLLAALWISRDMGGEYGWGHIFKSGYVKDGVPAILVTVLLFIFPSKLPQVFCRRPHGTREPFTPLMSWKVAAEKVPWGVVILLGGGFAMAHASKVSGLSAWIGGKLSGLDSLSPWVLNLVLCYIVAAMTEVTSNTATCNLMMPILAELAISLRQNPIYLMFPPAIATSFAFMLPVATPPNAVVFSYGYLKVKDMVVAGILLNILCVLALIGFTETLGDHLFDFHSLRPELVAYFNETASV